LIEAVAETEREVLIFIRCPYPKCPQYLEPRSFTVLRDLLMQMAEGSVDDKVMGLSCGHTWRLSDTEKRRIQARFADGSL